jgi:transcriptional regulator
MYLPAHFEESRPAVLDALMRAHPLATIVTLTGAGMVANQVPLLAAAAASGRGILRGHVARANPMWRDALAGVETLAIFQGPQAYVSPSWYPAKREHGKVVPTWNYCTVHAWGLLRVHEDAQWIRALLDELTHVHETPMEAPWSVDDAPAPYVAALVAQVVGIEIEVSRFQGKWKVSQNQPARNRAGVMAGLAAGGADQAAIADLIGRHAPPDGGGA